MAIPKISVFIPFGGALDSKTAPLTQPSTSLLTCDNVIQERRGEWRRRNGFTQVAVDTLSLAVAPVSVANMGDTGMVALQQSTSRVLNNYNPEAAFTASRFTQGSTITIAGQDNLEQLSLIMTAQGSSALNGFSSDGDIHVCGRIRIDGVNINYIAYFVNANTGEITGYGSFNGTGTNLSIRCACVPGVFQCAFNADTAGNLSVIKRNATTGVITVATVIKAGLNVTVPFLDAMYYTGSTITLVANMAAGGFEFIEYNPSTGTLTTDVNIAGAFVNCLSLIAEPSGSGTRLVATSDAANTVVRRINSAGTVLTTDTMEAVQSTQITGCASNAGADFGIVYQITAGRLRRNTKLGGVVGTASSAAPNFGFFTLPGSPITLAGQGWGEPNDFNWYYLIAANNSTAADPQFTLAIVEDYVQSTAGGIGVGFTPIAAVTPLQTQANSTNASLYQSVRVGTRQFYFGMPVETVFENIGGNLMIDYAMSSFKHTISTAAELSTLNIGWPVYRGKVPIFPGGIPSSPSLGSFAAVAISGATLIPSSLIAPPRQLIVSQSTSTGLLTLLGQYQYTALIELTDSFGRTWRSPPSVPASITLTGSNNTTLVTFSPWQFENQQLYGRLKIFRTQANGSVPTLVAQFLGDFNFLLANGNIQINDLLADSAITAGEILYTVGEQPNICWPAISHCWMFDGRFWGVNRDFRTEVQYSKTLQAQRQPETTVANVVVIDDQFGPITGGTSLEGRGVVFKKSALYFLQGDGLTDAGSGNNYVFNRINDDVGAIPGSPIINAGDAIYFVSTRGIYSIDAPGNLKFVGAALDQWFNQPTVNTPEVVYDGIYVPSRNEVRIVTTNYVFVYDRNFLDDNGIGHWSRWTLPKQMRKCLVVNGQLVLFATDGTVWKEGTAAQTTDQGTAFTGIVRTAWIRYAAGQLAPAPTQAPLRFYDGRIVMTRIAGGGSITATAKVYYNDDDTQTQTFTSQAIAGATLSDVGEFFPVQQKCTSFSLEIDLPSGDETLRVQGFAANIGVRGPSEQRRPSGEKWS